MELADDFTSKCSGEILGEDGESWAPGALSSSDLSVALWRNQKSILRVTAEGSMSCRKWAAGRLTSDPGS